ncbi:MAG: hypothetical protein HY360_24370 [Verrucomicrobia bacterium]|nr:hypothetical protein [Verrucomicrobiota bacterium]
MIDLSTVLRCALHGGFLIADIRLLKNRMVDALGREAVAQTTVNGRQLSLVLWAGLDDEELSVTLYHEVLEAVAVASTHPPVGVIEFNEGDFERAAREMYAMLGQASSENLNRMLQHFGFSGP